MLAVIALVGAQVGTISDVQYRLKAMEMQDQEVRFRFIAMSSSPEIAKSSQSVPKEMMGIIREMNRIDQADTEEMKAIITKYGWPTVSKFGKEAANTAWMIVQHADLDHPFQRRCLALMAPYVAKHEVSGPNYALLTDRVDIGLGRKQVYGSQFMLINGKLVMNPVEDPKNLDRRRKSVGLPSEANYIRMATEMYFPKKKETDPTGRSYPERPSLYLL